MSSYNDSGAGNGEFVGKLHCFINPLDNALFFHLFELIICEHLFIG